MGVVGSIGTQCSGEVVRVTTAIYQCSSPANTGKRACVICSPDPNNPHLMLQKKAQKKNSKSQEWKLIKNPSKITGEFPLICISMAEQATNIARPNILNI